MPEEKIQPATAITTAEYNKLKEKADRLDELLVIYKRHYGNVIEYAIELQKKAEKLGDISSYPEIKFGQMTVLDYLDLVERQAEEYTKRAITAESKLRSIKNWINEQPKCIRGSLKLQELDTILEEEA